MGRLLLNRYKQRKQASNNLTPEHCIEAARETAMHTRYCFLITTSGLEYPSVRLVEPIVDEDDLDFFIGTSPQSRKVKEIEAVPAVTLAFGNEAENANLIVHGRATVSHEPALKRQHWKSNWRLFFPGGPEGDDYCVISVRADTMELLSFRRNVIPEPFGLRPVVLEREGEAWRIR